MRNDTKYIAEGLSLAIAIALIAVAILFLTGCSTQKDNRALGRVLANADLTARVAKTLPPCANDTTYIRDTTTVIDTRYIQGDTVWQYHNDTLFAVIKDTVLKVVEIRKESVTVDLRAAQQWRDSADKYRNYFIAKDQALTQSIIFLKESEAEKKKRWWIIVVLIGIVAVSNGAWAYFAFKKP